ncbi:MAG: EAL domain-containing protein, partial [Bradymonadaceae bacterium]
IGYEALSRPAGDFDEQLGLPLFSAARKVELQAELDQLCRNLSVDRRPDLSAGRKLFVNCLPLAFYESDDALDRLLERWVDRGLTPEQLIFEINEDISQAQADRILPNVRRLRDRGFQFALDDMGTGKTNLRLLAELEPTYIKMDISLTRGIGDNVRKQALASYLLDLAEKSDARLIAEGIETERELETVVELGVTLGQGHLIGRPQ